MPKWADEPQTFIMLPVRPDRAKELSVSVNGAWAGIPGRFAILPHNPAIQTEYANDESAFATAVKKAGLIVPASINTIEGFDALIESRPELARLACRDAKGNVLDVGEMILMCSINREWIRWELEHGKAAIDAGANWILLDTPMGASFISGFLKGGFCRSCMDNFERYLKNRFTTSELARNFNVFSFDRRLISSRLARFQKVTPMKESVHLGQDADSRLFQQFVKCQEETNFATRRYLMYSLHRYAEQKGRKVLFCTNAADLGTQNPGGHWIRGLQFADLVDLFTYELNNEPEGRFGTPLTDLPRGKWAAFHKLAYAVHGRRGAALVHTQDTQLLRKLAEEGNSSRTRLAVHAVEAYAANGAYIPFHVEIGDFGKLPMKMMWKRVFEHNRFVANHKNLYRGELTSGSSVAMLFLFNERGRTIPAVFPSYLGMAQGFLEGNYPFDVVFAGDGKYVKDRLTLHELSRYQSLIIPSPVRPTSNQKKIVRAFVHSGGTVVCQEPDRLGIAGQQSEVRGNPDQWWESDYALGKGRVRVLRGEVTETDTRDVATRFYRKYSQPLRNDVQNIARHLGLSSVLKDHQDGLVSAFVVQQSSQKRVLVHLVNYDIDSENDEIRPKDGVRVTVAKPGFIGKSLSCELIDCTSGRKRSLNVERKGEQLEIVVPRLGLGAVILLQPDS